MPSTAGVLCPRDAFNVLGHKDILAYIIYKGYILINSINSGCSDQPMDLQPKLPFQGFSAQPGFLNILKSQNGSIQIKVPMIIMRKYPQKEILATPSGRFRAMIPEKTVEMKPRPAMIQTPGLPPMI